MIEKIQLKSQIKEIIDKFKMNYKKMYFENGSKSKFEITISKKNELLKKGKSFKYGYKITGFNTEIYNLKIKTKKDLYTFLITDIDKLGFKNIEENDSKKNNSNLAFSNFNNLVKQSKQFENEKVLKTYKSKDLINIISFSLNLESKKIDFSDKRVINGQNLKEIYNKILKLGIEKIKIIKIYKTNTRYFKLNQVITSNNITCFYFDEVFIENNMLDIGRKELKLSFENYNGGKKEILFEKSGIVTNNGIKIIKSTINNTSSTKLEKVNSFYVKSNTSSSSKIYEHFYDKNNILSICKVTFDKLTLENNCKEYYWNVIITTIPND